ncbi:hypothetical protein YH65_04145 [Sulfurovum lithotrophicum]|uniref:SH3b domain-containing protein n=1 Tax=Sulfurovum lithotrophicum TaxID=206403 RepID=A0A7U4M0N4_9BACT|nr:SH3 domain-containing protein [Sulfurovum lithotrophicum]AKF24665.1 hypothetical protein YH65_04145 [Sulfurovum lithotrophicum]
MIKFLILYFLFSSVSGWTGEVPLFAYVVNLSPHDTLNVRSSPDYHAKKTGALPLDARVGVDSCKKVGHSTWCKVFHLAQYDYDAFGYGAKPGWVNARYLTFSDRGYVLVEGEGNCDYVLGCSHGKCDIVSHIATRSDKVVGIETQKIARSRLKGASHFGAASKEMDGYCVTGRYIEDYLKEKALKTLRSKYDDSAYQKAVYFIRDFDVMWPEKISKYMHSNIGLQVSYRTCFGKESRLFTDHEIYTMEKNRSRVLFWRHTEGRGDKIYKSLYDVMKSMQLPVSEINQVKPLTSLRGFPCPKHRQCKGYAFLHINEDSDTKEYDWQGLVVILEKYQGKWYIVGLLKDRWTI